MARVVDGGEELGVGALVEGVLESLAAPVTPVVLGAAVHAGDQHAGVCLAVPAYHVWNRYIQFAKMTNNALKQIMCKIGMIRCVHVGFLAVATNSIQHILYKLYNVLIFWKKLPMSSKLLQYACIRQYVVTNYICK